MFFWIFPVALALGILVWILLRALKQYENESAAAALQQVSDLENRFEILQERVKALELIESDSILDIETGIEKPDSVDSLSLGRNPISE